MTSYMHLLLLIRSSANFIQVFCFKFFFVRLFFVESVTRQVNATVHQLQFHHNILHWTLKQLLQRTPVFYYVSLFIDSIPRCLPRCILFRAFDVVEERMTNMLNNSTRRVSMVGVAFPLCSINESSSSM